eukprot:4144738-Alexandrium_andersonii.AAC.1
MFGRARRRAVGGGVAHCGPRGHHHAGFRPAGGPLSAAAPVKPKFVAYNLDEFDRKGDYAMRLEGGEGEAGADGPGGTASADASPEPL